MYAYACVSSLSELNMTCCHFIWPTWQALRLSVSVSTLLFLSTPVPLARVIFATVPYIQITVKAL